MEEIGTYKVSSHLIVLVFLWVCSDGNHCFFSSRRINHMVLNHLLDPLSTRCWSSRHEQYILNIFRNAIQKFPADLEVLKTKSVTQLWMYAMGKEERHWEVGVHNIHRPPPPSEWNMLVEKPNIPQPSCAYRGGGGYCMQFRVLHRSAKCRFWSSLVIRVAMPNWVDS
jgi:hypothetical protein